MAVGQFIGAQDTIDQLLVAKYANTKTHNLEFDNRVETLPPDRYWSLMNFVALNNRFQANLA